MTRLLASLVVAVAALASSARADVTPIDFSDLWWNPAQNGWGLGMQRQGEVMFMTLFVYGADGTGTWFVASDSRPAATATPAWSGKLYRTSGPGFAAPFDSAATVAEAGELTVQFLNANAGLLTYSVDGTTVVSPIERTTWRELSPAGAYYGGMSVSLSQCTDIAMDGTLDLFGSLAVTQAARSVTMRVTSTSLAGLASSCTFTGDYGQSGRMGRMAGNYRCSIVVGQDDRGENTRVVDRLGTFVMERMAVTANGFSARLAAADQDCQLLGRFGGLRLP